jgi:hypothetical protein
MGILITSPDRRLKFLIGVLIALNVWAGAWAEEGVIHVLRPFRTNGCSAPFTITDQAWTDCCTHHDFAYWVCGDRADKRRADAELVNCLWKTGISGAIAAKIFEWAPQRLSESAWCSRWSNARKPGPLTPSELRQVQQYEASFSLKFPITKTRVGRDCAPDELPESLRGVSNPVCFDLVKLSSSQINDDRLVYSDDCVGYFIVHNKISAQGFGQCADLTLGHQNGTVPNCYFGPSPSLTYSGIISRMNQILTHRPFEAF